MTTQTSMNVTRRVAMKAGLGTALSAFKSVGVARR
jgi:hypothetical protein